MKWAILLIFAIVLSCPVISRARSCPLRGYELADLTQAGFDARRGILWIEANLIYPNSCYSPFENLSITRENTHEIFLNHIVSVSENMCTMFLVHRRVSFEMRAPRVGQYRVYDQNTLKYLGILLVTKNFAGLLAENPNW